MKRLPPPETVVCKFFSKRKAISGMGVGVFASFLIFTLLYVGRDDGAARVDSSASLLLWVFSVDPPARSSDPPAIRVTQKENQRSKRSPDFKRATSLASGRIVDPKGTEMERSPRKERVTAGNRSMSGNKGAQGKSSGDKTRRNGPTQRRGSGGNTIAANATAIEAVSAPTKPIEGSSSSRSSGDGRVRQNATDISHGSRLTTHKNVVLEKADNLEVSSSKRKRTLFDGSCDIFDGKWVKDESRPLYPPGSCPLIDSDFNCYENGRPDDDFLRWRWQPNECEIPSLNATDFLRRLTNKRLIFVGDSLNRNMWESLVCILRHSVEDKDGVYEMSGRRQFKTSGYYSYVFKEYNCSVDFVRSAFLVRENIDKLRLDSMDETTSAYRTADIIVFNTGHWWTHEKTSKGGNYYQEGDLVHPVLDVMEAYKTALLTWARWMDENIDPGKTQVIFRGYSLTHFSGGQWNSGGQCHKETEPISNQSFLRAHPEKMKVLEEVLKRMKTPVIFLNVSRLTDHRKDGHPSVYRPTIPESTPRVNAPKSQDCSHWCLPGVPDTWNELLYASLLKAGRESWAPR